MLTLKATTPDIQRQARALWQSIQNDAAREYKDTAPVIDKDMLVKYRGYFDKRVDDLALSLATNEITVNQWQRQMTDEVEKLHITGWVVGRGGLDGMSRADLKEVRRKIGEQLQYLDNWAGEIRQQRNSGAEFDPAKIAFRARMYGGAASATVNQANTAAVGIPRLSNYPGDGKTKCRVNCKCTLKIEKLKGVGDYDIYWKLNPAEHCEDCLELSKKWNPLRVRKGVVLK